MKYIISLALVMSLSIPVQVYAQQTLAATLDVYVFPSAGQSSSQQSIDEGECYNWAVQNSGVDPFALQKQSSQQQQQNQQAREQVTQSAQGSGLRGAARGAAAGALIGEVADDDAGKGAAIGAAVGALGARRRANIAQEQQSQQIQAQSQQHQQIQAQSQQHQQVSAQEMTNFKKAFSVCLEAKKYMVKY